MIRALVVVVALAGCRGGPPPVTANDAARAHVELAELQRGRSLLVTKCGNCHRPPMPSDQPSNAWPKKIDEMSGRANLDFGQRRLIEMYVVAMAPR